MKRTAILLIGVVFLGACGTAVDIQKITTEHETCVYEQKYHKFTGNYYGRRVLIACTPDTNVGIK